MDGILLFNKPILWTSHDAVDFIRRRTNQRAVGHAGTLDPMATGLLVILLGSSTKLSGEFSGHDKDYRGVMTFGIKTDTLDMEGRILSEIIGDPISESRLAGVLSGFEGPLDQKPPAYSAVKKHGKKLYEYSRRGIAVEVEARPVQILRFSLVRWAPPDAVFFLSCSKGTYVRSLCEEAGNRLGQPAVLSALVRTRVGPLALEGACTAERFARMKRDEIERCLIASVPRITGEGACGGVR